MLLNAGDIVQTIADLMDDPAGVEFDFDYCLPKIRLAWTDLSVEMEALGLTYEEQSAVLTVAAGSVDLSSFQAAGAPLESMMQPIKIEWKHVGEDDTQYRPSSMKVDIPDVPPASVGLLAWHWGGGVIQITPSAQDIIARVKFNAFELTLSDPNSRVVIGVGNIIAYKALELFCGPTIKNNAPGALQFRTLGLDAKDNFELLAVKQKNRQHLRIGKAHGFRRRALLVGDSGGGGGTSGGGGTTGTLASIGVITPVTSITLDRTYQTTYVMAAGGQTITLNHTNPANGDTVTVKKLDIDSGGTVAVQTGAFIDLEQTYSLINQEQYVTVVYDGTNWKVVGSN